MKKFLEFVGKASTSAIFNGRKIGHAVCAAAYSDGDNIILQLESNGSRVFAAAPITMTKDEYDAFCEKQSRPLFVRGIELFGAKVLLGESE